MMKKQKLVLAVALTTGLSAASSLASAQEYLMLVPTNVQNGDWRSIDPLYTAWVDEGGHYDCLAWDPSVSEVDFGQGFLQYRDCQQDQNRSVTTREEHSGSGEVRETGTHQESRTITETESQNAEGTRQDWQPTSSTYTEWSDSGADYGHTEWSPAASNQTADFTQSRNYQQDQTRTEQKRERDDVTGDIRNVGAPVPQSRTQTRSETRDVTVSSSAWTNTASKTCGAWSPSPATVDYGQTFTQNRTCDQDQQRVWSYNAGGSEIHSRQESRVNTFNESQQATGERRDWQPTSSTFTEWSDIGGPQSYTAWSPQATTQTTTFTQTRSYQQPQERHEQKREQDQVTGDIRNDGEPIRHTQNDPRTENRDVTVRYSNWANSGTPTNCSAWAPDPSTVDYGTAYTQSRMCDQSQSRERIYESGGSHVATQNESQTIQVTEEQGNTGTKRNWQPIESTYTAWTNDGARYGHTSWGPAPTTQTTGFTQTRNYSQDQDRYEQKREQDQVTGDIRNVGDPILREQTVSDSESRAITVSWSNWADTGSHYACGTWSPDASTVNYGEAFTQTRSCSQDQSRDRIYQHGSTTIHTAAESRTVSASESQASTGTKRNWQPTDSTYTAWTNDGARYGHTAWSPEATTQTSSFTQSRNYSQDQDRYEQKREQDQVTGDIRNDGDPILRERTTTGSESRNVTVSWTPWTNSGSTYNCSTWSPSTDTVNYGDTFTQTRNCDQNEARDRVYKVGADTIATKPESRTVRNEESRQATGTYQNWEPMTSSASSWSDDGSGYNHSAWSPEAANQTSDFQQSQSYDQNQSRTVQNKEYDTVTGQTRNSGEPYTETRTVSQSNTRTVDVAVSSWSDSGSAYGCSSWSPSTSTVNQGQSFTQTRNCTQGITRTWTYTADASTIHSRQESSTKSVQQSRTATGTKPVSECRYTYNTSNGYFITDNRSMGMIRLQWSTDYWFHNTYSMPTESSAVSRGGYKYWAGAKKTSTYYEICRKPG